MPYATLADLSQNTLLQVELQQVTDRADSPTGEANAVVLQRALVAADRLIDSFLAARYLVPVSAPELMTDLAVTVARWYLHTWAGAVPEAVKDAYDSAVSLLRLFSDGRARVPGATLISATRPGYGSAVIAPPVVFGTDFLSNY